MNMGGDGGLMGDEVSNMPNLRVAIAKLNKYEIFLLYYQGTQRGYSIQ
jgi:hypothetical protein